MVDGDANENLDMTMIDMIESPLQFYRTDALTGVGNLLGFFEWLLNRRKSDLHSPFTLVSLDISGLAGLNETSGRTAGDTALRWVAIVLKEETEAQIYRIGPEEFVLVLTDGVPKSRTALVERIAERLNKEASQVGLRPPVARIAVIHYTGQEGISPESVLGVFYAAISDLKQSPGVSFKVFDAAKAEPSPDLGWIVNDIVDRMVSLGVMLDELHHLAYTDAITGLPNMNAALKRLETTLAQVESAEQPFALLLIDGDDLRRYNEISYAAGDEMIQRLGSTLKAEIRPSDFIARWRSGDEFFVLLPATSTRQAVAVGKRLCNTVQEASREWRFRITISSGVASYPEHGKTASGLLHQAEIALDRAKKMGKNQVVAA
jgi:diguanylate cyclase (GGDEF)-like protein